MQLTPQPLIRFNMFREEATSGCRKKLYNVVLIPLKQSDSSNQQDSRGIMVSAKSDTAEDSDDKEVSEALTTYFSRLLIDLQVRYSIVINPDLFPLHLG